MRLLYFTIINGLLSPLSFAQCTSRVLGSVLDDWVFPSLPELSITLYQDQTYNITWTTELQCQIAEFCTNCSATDVDLWVIGVDNNLELHLAASIDTTSVNSFEWENTIPDATIESEAYGQWYFAFMEAGSSTGAQIQSPNVFINVTSSSAVLSQIVTSSATSVIITHATTTTTHVSSTHVSSSTTPSSSPSSTGTGINPGSAVETSLTKAVSTASSLPIYAKVLIVVAAVLGVALAITLGFLCRYRSRRRRVQQAGRHNSPTPMLQAERPTTAQAGRQDSPIAMVQVEPPATAQNHQGNRSNRYTLDEAFMALRN